MNRKTPSHAALLVTGIVAAVAAVGCSSNEYQPNATEAQLASYAAQDKYPTDMNATPAENLFYSIADDGTITLNNAGDRSLASFDLWVNKSYVEMVDQLPAHSMRTFPPDKLYNSGGAALKSEPVNQNWTVQIREAGRLMDVKGPVKM